MSFITKLTNVCIVTVVFLSLGQGCGPGSPMEATRVSVDCDGDGLADPDGCLKYCEETTPLHCCAAYCPDGFESSKVAKDINEKCAGALGFPSEDEGCIPRDNPEDVDCDGDGIPNENDSAPCDGSTQRFCTDTDGDGYSGSSCTSFFGYKPLGEGWVSDKAPSDCDDNDAMRFRNTITDADGDGFTVWVCAGAQTIEHEVPSSSVEYDCDDLDATVQRTFYADSDGDGYAATSDYGTCVSADAVPSATLLSSPGLDCNDDDPLIHPEQAEWFDDAVDANCDRAGESQNCATLDGSRGRCGDVTWPRDATCTDNADIVITGTTWEFLTCAQNISPKEIATVSVANAGLVPYEGRLRVRQGTYVDNVLVTSNDETFLETTLAPGETRVIELAHPYTRIVEVAPEGQPDCHPDNNTATLHIAPADCD